MVKVFEIVVKGHLGNEILGDLPSGLKEFVAALQAAEPTKAVHTDNTLNNMVALDAAFSVKFDTASVGHSNANVPEEPHRVAHEVEPTAGKWTPSPEGNGLIYDCHDVNGNPDYEGFISIAYVLPK